MPSFKIASGEKYAIMALPGCWIADDLPEELQLADGLWASRRLPIKVDEHWKDWLGSLMIERLEETGLFLLTSSPSVSPAILDGENRDLQDRVWRLYWGLLLCGFMRTGDKPLRLTGAHSGDRIDVRSLGEVEQPHFVLGSPIAEVAEEHLRQAAEIGENLDKLQQHTAHMRIWRVTHAYYAAMTASDWAVRLHQFVRCVEGFILPDTGQSTRQFKSRTELFVGPRHHKLMGELYEIRSSVEHLHSPYETVTGSSERERRLLVLRRTMEAEALARYCVSTLLMNPAAWLHFQDDSALSSFWKLSASDRQAIWGTPMDLNAVSQGFDETFIDDEDLGL
jgi:hypothetical protein